MADVWFAKETTAETPPLAELLVDAAEPLPGAAMPASIKPEPTAVQPPVVAPSVGVSGATSGEEELRQQSPLV
jgi:hypothetical protein